MRPHSVPGRFGRCGCRTRVPATLAGGQRVRGIISGDLVAVENNKIGACGVKRGLDEADGVFADFRPVLDVGELQYAEFAGLVELQAAKPCGYGKRSTVPLFRWLDARARGFGGMLQFGHTSRVMQHWAITCAIHAGRQQIALPHRIRQNPSTHRPKRREQTGAKNKNPRICEGSLAGMPGLEPRMAEPESAVLPITPHPNLAGVATSKSCPSYPRPDLNRCWRRERA